jgi:hypothetical protein
MKKIWKFYLGIGKSVVALEMPSEFDFLHIGFDPRGLLCIWALCNPDSIKARLHFLIALTGEEVNTDKIHSHVGTVKQGELMFHVFQVKN